MKKILEINDLKTLARKKLPKMFYDYVDSGSYTESTYKANEMDFEKIGVGNSTYWKRPRAPRELRKF